MTIPNSPSDIGCEYLSLRTKNILRDLKYQTLKLPQAGTSWLRAPEFGAAGGQQLMAPAPGTASSGLWRKPLLWGLNASLESTGRCLVGLEAFPAGWWLQAVVWLLWVTASGWRRLSPPCTHTQFPPLSASSPRAFTMLYGYNQPCE